MSVLTLKHPGGEVGDESWSQASGPREQWPSPGKRSRGFWPVVLVNWTCPSVYVPTSRVRCPHLPTWGVARPASALEGECGVLVGTHGTV